MHHLSQSQIYIVWFTYSDYVFLLKLEDFKHVYTFPEIQHGFHLRIHVMWKLL
jgi:hypothetical protein